MRIVDVLRKPTTLHVIFAILFIIPFQTILFFPFTLETLDLLREPPTDIIQTEPILLVGYIILPIIYCIIVSLFLKPKTLVNPIHIQIGAYFISSVIIINGLLANTEFTSELFINLFGVLVFISMYILMIALIQFFIVWWVIGLNYDGSTRQSFVINGSPNEIMKILGKDFLRIRNFNKPKPYGNPDNPIIFTKCNELKHFVIVAFGAYQNSNNKCVLSTVAFHRGVSWVSESPRANAISDSIISYVKVKLQEKNTKYKITKLDKVDDFVSSTAFSFIEAITQPKIYIILEFFEKISSFFRYAIYLTIGAFLIFSIACLFGFIIIDSYVVAIVPTIIALAFEIGISLREEFSFKKMYDYF